jgi:hypothetical protein
MDKFKFDIHLFLSFVNTFIIFLCTCHLQLKCAPDFLNPAIAQHRGCNGNPHGTMILPAKGEGWGEGGLEHIPHLNLPGRGDPKMQF